jgi:YD repeat-containing protein
MTKRFDVGAPTRRPSLDGQEIVGVPVQFYRRNIRGGEACGVWVGGEPLYDINVYDRTGSLVGVVEPEASHSQQNYDELRRVLVRELIHSDAHSSVHGGSQRGAAG